MLFEKFVGGRVGVRAMAVGMVAAIAGAAHGQSFSGVQFWVGSGANRAAFVVDFNDGQAPESLVWGFRWDGTATGEDMLNAIVTADTRLYAHVSTPFSGGLGTALFGVGYDRNNNGVFGVSPTVTFDAGGISIGAPDDTRVATDAGDQWREGWWSGYWSYWLGGNADSPVWDYSGVGMSSRVLTDGAWDGWSFHPDFMGDAPSVPVAAPVPAPGVFALLGAGGVFAARRRRGRAASVKKTVAAAIVVGGAAATSASASYVYDANDFAVEVVSATGFPVSPTLYTDPNAVLGGPSTMFRNTFPASDRRVKLIEPAYNVSPASMGSQRLITTFNVGQSVTVRMGRTVHDDPNNPFGIDLNVFGNAFFTATGGTGPGGFVDDATNLNNVTVGGVFAEPVRVSVSSDNVNWYTYTGITGDGYFPTNAYRWDSANAAWTNELLDPTLPVNPAYNAASFGGGSAAQALALYNGSAGGTGFDLSVSGFSFINYVRFDGITGFSGGEIDAVAAVRAIPAPGAMALIGVVGAVATRRRRLR